MSSTTASGSASGAWPTTTTTESWLPQPERGGPGPQRVVGLAAQQRVDDQRLQPGVPGAAGLGRLGVDLGRGEGDLAGVAQHRLAQLLPRRPGAICSICSSTTAMTTRTSSTVCCRVTERVSSRGAVPNTSALIACGASGWRNHSTNAATPAWATRLTHDRFSAGIARYQGSTSSIRAIAAVARVSMLPSRRRTMVGARRGMAPRSGQRSEPNLSQHHNGGPVV